MEYIAGTKIFRMHRWEDVSPFLKLGKRVAVGKRFPLRYRELTLPLFNTAKAEWTEGSKKSDFFYLIRK